MKCTAFALLVALWPQGALSHTMGVFADALGSDCNLVIPYPGGSVTAYVVGTIDQGMTVVAAEFRIGGIPDGWTASVSAVDPEANVSLGNPFSEGIQIAYPGCLTGRRVLLTLSITPSSNVANAGLAILPHLEAQPLSCGFEGYSCGQPCPLFCGCNGFGLDCLCVEPMPATINGSTCIVRTEDQTWGHVKNMYK